MSPGFGSPHHSSWLQSPTAWCHTTNAMPTTPKITDISCSKIVFKHIMLGIQMTFHFHYVLPWVRWRPRRWRYNGWICSQSHYRTHRTVLHMELAAASRVRCIEKWDAMKTHGTPSTATQRTFPAHASIKWLLFGADANFQHTIGTAGARHIVC